jgi:hypothetical protein
VGEPTDRSEDEERARGGSRDASALRDALPKRLSPEEAAAALLSGDAWHRYCDALKQAGDHLLSANANASDSTRAEGIRYLLGLVKGGIGQALELADPNDPRFFRNPDSTARWGAENADNQYLWTRIDPSGRYRIEGRRESAFDFLIEVKQGYMQLGDERNFATLTADEIDCEADGRFEIVASAERVPGNWLPLDADARYLAIRQYFCDWRSEIPARFHIERLDPPPPAPARLDEVASALQDAADWTLQTARTWTEWTERLRESFRPERIAPARKFAGGADDIYYGNDFYRLGPDEAMLIETELPDARYWQFQLCDLWFRSADWARRATSINHAQARLDSDGRFRCVVAHRDPGVANWLDTAGEPEGLVQYRWIWSRDNPHPTSRIVPFNRLLEQLPPDTPMLSPDERDADLRLRRRHREVREPAT